MSDTMKKKKIAVIGGGIAGIICSFLLQQKYKITLYEKNDYIGGHTNTIPISEGVDAGIAVDTGFIVFNDQTYPQFSQFLQLLEIETQHTDMSFSYYDESSGFQYAGTNLNGLFGQRKNLFSLSFYRMTRDILRFNKRALRDLTANQINTISLGDYVRDLHLSQMCIDQYIVPMGAAIWSTPAAEVLQYPAYNFIQFFRNHGLLSVTQHPQWQTVKGGSYAYVNKFLKQFQGDTILQANIERISRHDDYVTLHWTNGREENYDYVILATHADQALPLLEKPTQDEQVLLGSWNYSKNDTVLHTDHTVLPPLQRCWASWNYAKEKGVSQDQPVSVTYDMNRLQRLQSHEQYCVSLNRKKTIPEANIIKEMVYTHPIYTKKSLASQANLPKLNGVNRTYFCGSYFGNGFHEDAVRSATQVAAHFGVTL